MLQKVQHSLTEFAARMGRWFISWAIVIGGCVLLGWITIQHRVPSEAEWLLIGLLSVLAGMLGMVAAIAWELTHVEVLMRFVRSRRQKPH